MRVVRHIEQQAFRVTHVISPDGGALRVGSIGIPVTVPDVIGGEGTTIVEVRLEPGQVVANEKQLSKRGRRTALALNGFDETAQHLISMRIVRRRSGERSLVLLVVGENQSEVVSLHAGVAGSYFSPRPRRDLRE